MQDFSHQQYDYDGRTLYVRTERSLLILSALYPVFAQIPVCMYPWEARHLYDLSHIAWLENSLAVQGVRAEPKGIIYCTVKKSQACLFCEIYPAKKGQYHVTHTHTCIDGRVHEEDESPIAQFVLNIICCGNCCQRSGKLCRE